MWPATARIVVGLVHGAGAGGDLGVALLAAQHVSQLLVCPTRAEAVYDVGDRGRAVAQRVVGVAGTARQLDRRRQQHGLQRRQVRRRRRQPEQGRRPVGPGPAEQVVVDLHDDPAAGRAAVRRTPARRPTPARRAPRRRATGRCRGRCCSAGRCRRSRSSPRRDPSASSCSAAATWFGSARNRITWCTTWRLSGSTNVPVR